MANPFLTEEYRDIETAIMLEQTYQHDIGKSIAYTDGHQVFINTDDNLNKLLPDYNYKMLKWILWHERFHNELRHHNRFFKYLKELDKKELKDKFQVTQEEVNIIMDILVHDSLSKLFPELVDTAIINLAQLRNRNSLEYTFKTHTLEEMLDEYKEHKKPKEEKSKDEEKKSKDEEEKSKDEEKKKSKDEEKKDDGKKSKEGKSKKSDGEKVSKTVPDSPTDEEVEHHGETDWSKLDDIDGKEFITEKESQEYIDTINELKNAKIKLGRLTETLNGLVTNTRQRTYAMPSSVKITGGAILKGSRPGKTKLYLCFDASGSMDTQMQTFKDIISKSIPQAMDTPTAWFSGLGETVQPDPDGRSHDYYKATFKDFLNVRANLGYDDDGDRTIELCYKAEQQGYTPIGITDGGGQISWSKDMLKKLKRTILVGQRENWLRTVKEINPNIKTLDI